jgi:Rrf2 family protein
MVSQTTRYALIILGHLANQGEAWCPVAGIAEATCVPANYLSKILNRLAKYGVVDSLKGWGGGFRLRPEALERPIRDVLVILDGQEPDGVQACIFGFPRCDDADPCPLHDHWKQIRQTYDRMLGETIIGELRTGGPRKSRRCGPEQGPAAPPRRVPPARTSRITATRKPGARP